MRWEDPQILVVPASHSREWEFSQAFRSHTINKLLFAINAEQKRV